MEEVPWLPPQALEFLESFLSARPESRVLEFGCGGSTLWLSKRAKHLISVEHDLVWHRRISGLLPENSRVAMLLRPRPYAGVCDIFEPNGLDLVVLNGVDHGFCAQQARSFLKTGGVMLLTSPDEKEDKAVHTLLKRWAFEQSPAGGKKDLRACWWIKPRSLAC